MCWCVSLISALQRQKLVDLSLRQAWRMDSVSGQPSLGSEGNHQKQRIGEDIVEWRGDATGPLSSTTWQLQPHDWGVKNGRKGSRNLPLWPRKTSEARTVSGVSLNWDQFQALSEDIEVNLGIPWRLQDVRDATGVRYLAREGANGLRPAQAREVCCSQQRWKELEVRREFWF